jgi:nicotinate-nucleotide--dimethylbenzimidazole phosphoribosyltransferase
MSVATAGAALEVGGAEAAGCIAGGADLLVAGDMGIGNTTAAACLVAALCDREPAEVVGPGAGVPAGGLDHKVRLVEAGAARVRGWTDPVAVLAEVGGYEIAAMAGFYLEAATRRVPFVVDGVIALAALLVADAVRPGTGAAGLAGHRSPEPGATVALAHLGLRPLLDLGMRLGEGTGAVLAVPLVIAAATALRDMAELPT